MSVDKKTTGVPCDLFPQKRDIQSELHFVRNNQVPPHQ